jgi:hypothetical protein
MVTSISAVASYGGRVYVGDYTAQWIKSVDGVTFGDEQQLMRDTAVVDLKVSPNNVLVYIDIDKGWIQNVPLGDNVVLASPSPAPAAPFATIVPRTATWVPGEGRVTVSSTNNVEAREGATFQWTVVLLSNCNAAADTCSWTWAFTAMGGATFSFDAPNAAGVVAAEITLTVRTMAGLQATAKANLPVAGAAPCPCNGVRTNVALQPLPANPGTGGGGGGGGLTGLSLQANQQTWTPGIGILSWNLQSNVDLGARVNYQCSVIALTQCLAATDACSWTYLFGPMDLGAHPVFSFNSPLIQGGGTLEITCTAVGNGLVQTAKAQIPSAGQILCPCTGVRTNAAVQVLTNPWAGPNPPPGAAIVPEQAQWEPGQGRLAFVANSGLQNVPGTTYNWMVTLLYECSDSNTDCSWSFLFSAVAGQRLEFASPNIPGGGTLEVAVDIRALDGSERVERTSVQLASFGQQQCVCAGVRTQKNMQALPSASPVPGSGGPINHTPSGPTTVTPMQSWWNPRGTGRLTFVATSPLDKTAGVQYVWTVLLLTRCSLDGGDCGWSLLFQTDGTNHRALSFDPPAVLLGGSLEVTVVVTTTARNISTGVARIPSQGQTVCPCTGNRVQVPLRNTNTGSGDQTETYMYSGTVVTTTPPSPVSSNDDRPWWQRIDTASTPFIAGVASAATVIGAAVLVAAGYLVSRGAPDRDGAAFFGGRAGVRANGAGGAAAGGAGRMRAGTEAAQSVTSTTSITAVPGSPTTATTTSTLGGGLLGRKQRTGMSPRRAGQNEKSALGRGGNDHRARDDADEDEDLTSSSGNASSLAQRRANHPGVAPLHTSSAAAAAVISPASGNNAGTPQGPRRV